MIDSTFHVIMPLLLLLWHSRIVTGGAVVVVTRPYVNGRTIIRPFQAAILTTSSTRHCKLHSYLEGMFVIQKELVGPIEAFLDHQRTLTIVVVVVIHNCIVGDHCHTSFSSDHLQDAFDIRLHWSDREQRWSKRIPKTRRSDELLIFVRRIGI